MQLKTAENPAAATAPAEFAELFAAEDRHFWFRARNETISTVIQQLTADLPNGYRVLEIGCGTGNVLRELVRVCTRGEVIGTDLFEEGLKFARTRVPCRIVQSDIYQMPTDDPVHIVGMFDVLEHLSEDGKALRGVHARLADGGRLVLTVPAHMALWSHVDVVAQHHRRYGTHELTRVLQANGFVVEYLTQFMMTLFPLMWGSRRLASLMGRSHNDQPGKEREMALQELRIVPILNGVLYRMLAGEKALIARRCKLPIGTSLLAIARKATMPGAGFGAVAA